MNFVSIKIAWFNRLIKAAKAPVTNGIDEDDLSEAEAEEDSSKRISTMDLNVEEAYILWPEPESLFIDGTDYYSKLSKQYWSCQSWYEL